jgi:catechol 2,3-dioxygenase-like lactoylglutathione lyase family enzyme
MSLGNAPLVAFAPTTDLDRAREFYVGVLGLTLEETNPFACVVRGGGTMLRLTKVDSFTPHPFTVLAPSGARIAWFPDPDGNVLSLSQV